MPGIELEDEEDDLRVVSLLPELLVRLARLFIWVRFRVQSSM